MFNPKGAALYLETRLSAVAIDERSIDIDESLDACLLGQMSPLTAVNMKHYCIVRFRGHC